MKRSSKQSKKRRDRKTSTRNYAEVYRNKKTGIVYGPLGTPVAIVDPVYPDNGPVMHRRTIPIGDGSGDRFGKDFAAPQLGKR